MGDLSIKEVSSVLGCSPDTVARYVSAGEFPSAYRIGVIGPWRIPREDVDKARDRWRGASKSNGSNTAAT